MKEYVAVLKNKVNIELCNLKNPLKTLREFDEQKQQNNKPKTIKEYLDATIKYQIQKDKYDRIYNELKHILERIKTQNKRISELNEKYLCAFLTLKHTNDYNTLKLFNVRVVEMIEIRLLMREYDINLETKCSCC
jgi:hypothetical protein